MSTDQTAPADAGTFVISRVFAAPRERVWEAWTKPDLFAQWFGPTGTTTSIVAHDLSPGGMLHYRMVMPDGGGLYGRSVYREIIPPSRLVWDNSFADAEAKVIRAPFFDGLWPLEMLTTLVLAEDGAGTRLTLTWAPIDASDAERQAVAANTASLNYGWTGTFDRFDAFLAGAPVV